ncbi:hypothetical protein SMC7_00700 [Candidatus Cryosericum terrychapinii]|uniref:Uncharacterized protein n=1 Tax=Candidatus Cryosericum terrychapinii TaxID=2290919 RepID=A0A398CX64_9BACT|nr:hypothetical protein SMC7_00700 [Candidatus Cryosericum terrychapinii]
MLLVQTVVQVEWMGLDRVPRKDVQGVDGLVAFVSHRELPRPQPLSAATLQQSLGLNSGRPPMVAMRLGERLFS